MTKELYIDISNEEAGGSLYRVTGPTGETHFHYNHSSYNSDTDELQVFETNYPDFASFWQYIVSNPQWFYLHPLYIHPEQRAFIQAQLKNADWEAGGNIKWQQSHQRQWKKVLEAPDAYYKGPQ